MLLFTFSSSICFYPLRCLSRLRTYLHSPLPFFTLSSAHFTCAHFFFLHPPSPLPTPSPLLLRRLSPSLSPFTPPLRPPALSRFLSSLYRPHPLALAPPPPSSPSLFLPPLPTPSPRPSTGRRPSHLSHFLRAPHFFIFPSASTLSSLLRIRPPHTHHFCTSSPLCIYPLQLSHPSLSSSLFPPITTNFFNSILSPPLTPSLSFLLLSLTGSATSTSTLHINYLSSFPPLIHYSTPFPTHLHPPLSTCYLVPIPPNRCGGASRSARTRVLRSGTGLRTFSRRRRRR